LDAARADAAALAALLQRVAPDVRRAIRADLPARWRHLLTADDVLQQSFVDAFHDFAGFAGDSPAALRRWLMRIAKRNLLDAVRAVESEKRGGGRRYGASDTQQSCLDLLQMLSASVTQPDQAAARAEAAEMIRSAVAALPGPYRDVVEAYDIAGREMADIAEGIGRTRGAAYMLRARAHRLLRRQLGDTTRFFCSRA
jgi:RNA polymerase sigma factor (sigma-70 family)